MVIIWKVQTLDTEEKMYVVWEALWRLVFNSEFSYSVISPIVPECNSRVCGDTEHWRNRKKRKLSNVYLVTMVAG